MIFLPETPLPVKPRHKEACNGCGLCCSIELCVAAEKVGFTKAPCPALQFREGRTFCGLVLAEKFHEMTPVIAESLGIGKGCSMEDGEEV